MDNLEKIVLLIDADNTQLSKIEAVIREISTHGRIIVKRAYGNWKKDALKNWENELKRLAIKAEQQFDYVSGKNATDMALVIDTLDLLHKGIYDGFVIVASDSDYTPLAIKLHESGVYVIGVGERKTPEAFRNACDEFLFLENLDNDIKEESAGQTGEAEVTTSKRKRAGKASAEKKQPKNDNDMNEIHKLLQIAANTFEDADGYVNVGAAGSFIKRAKPDFDTRTYGYAKLTQLIEAFPKKYEIKRCKGTANHTTVLYKCR